MTAERSLDESPRTSRVNLGREGRVPLRQTTLTDPPRRSRPLPKDPPRERGGAGGVAVSHLRITTS